MVMKRTCPSSCLVLLAALALFACLPAPVRAAPATPGAVRPDAYRWRPFSATAVNVTGSVALEMAAAPGQDAAAQKPVAMRFDLLGRVPVQFVGAFDAASVAPATVWVVNLEKPDAALSCGANPVKAFVVETEPSSRGGRLNLYGLDQRMATVPDIKSLPTACFLAVYLHH